jgi:two-component system chemotaxis response regulator CheV
MMNTAAQKEIDERTNLTASNKFEMLLFKLGANTESGRSELFGINVFKVREIVAMPTLTTVAGAPPHVLGVVNLRGQIMSVIDLPALVGCKPAEGTSIMLITEFARTVQAFAAESVEDIVRLEWSQILSAESAVGSSTGAGMVTSIARLTGDDGSVKLVQILDVESILRKVFPDDGKSAPSGEPSVLRLRPGTKILFADDSFVARSLIEQELKNLDLPYVVAKTGKEAWTKLNDIAQQCAKTGGQVSDHISLVLTDLEMPEMDGFTLTRNIKSDPRMKTIPVVIHSSLTGDANEAHVRKAGADAYVPKFSAKDLTQALRLALGQ